MGHINFSGKFVLPWLLKENLNSELCTHSDTKVTGTNSQNKLIIIWKLLYQTVIQLGLNWTSKNPVVLAINVCGDFQNFDSLILILCNRIKLAVKVLLTLVYTTYLTKINCTTKRWIHIMWWLSSIVCDIVWLYI